MSFGEGNLRTAVAELTQEKRELEARIDKLMALNGELCAEVNEKDARIRELERERDALIVVDWWTDEHGDTHVVAANDEEICHYVKGEHAEMSGKALVELKSRVHELESFVSDYGRVCGGLCVDCEYGNPNYPNESDEMCLLAVSVKAYEIEVANG